MKVFLVDDDEFQCEFLKGLLTSAGIEVKTTTDSSNIIEEVLKYNPSLIILDLYMPNKSGKEVCSELTSEVLTRDIPVMFLSSSEDKLDKEECFKKGCIDFVEKPIKIGQFINKVKKYAYLGRLAKEVSLVRDHQCQLSYL